MATKITMRSDHIPVVFEVADEDEGLVSVTSTRFVTVGAFESTVVVAATLAGEFGTAVYPDFSQ
jgi:hypothetical protein